VANSTSPRNIRQSASFRGERRWTLRLEQVGKRGFDMVFSLFALVFISPVLLTIAVLVKLDSEGPVFYVSERIGRNGRRFGLLKFRTMVKDADMLPGALLQLNERRGNLIKTSNCLRVTRVGKLLRRFELDELPQLLNVFAGQMSMVGPRSSITSMSADTGE
jgi:lipopolysaccharide/colanic/teichoic acid biosynthesis glycosyltransferase